MGIAAVIRALSIAVAIAFPRPRPGHFAYHSRLMSKTVPATSAACLPNALGVPCQVDDLRIVRSEDALLRALSGAQRDALVVGQCSNLVLPRWLSGPVLVAAWRGLRAAPCGADVLVTAAAGECWHSLVRYSLGKELGGLENLALIPGSVGAAPIQNIGAYGVELAELLTNVRVYDRFSGRVRALPASACGFGYRTSLFKRDPARYVVLGLSLRLSPRSPLRLDYPDVRLELERLGWRRPTHRQMAEAVIGIRRRKLPNPKRWGNAGSFFKNPVVSARMAERLAARQPQLVRRQVAGGVKLAAAQLIDLCGWKGRRLGRVAVWRRQPLVLVNLGGATGEDFMALGERIRSAVAQRFGVRLELEPSNLCGGALHRSQ